MQIRANNRELELERNYWRESTLTRTNTSTPGGGVDWLSRMVALRRMARSQEKINESQELTIQDDIVLSIPPRRDDEERRGWKRRKNGNPDSWEWKGGG